MERRPEEFGVTGMMFYDDPKIAALYWSQLPPKDFLATAVHDARNRLAQSVVTLQMLLDRAEVGVISLEGQLGKATVKEYLELNLKALNELWNVIETVAQYANKLETPADK